MVDKHHSACQPSVNRRWIAPARFVLMSTFRFLEDNLGTDGMPGDDGQSRPPGAAALDRPPSEAEALDAYSRVVTAVARDLAPSVANLRVTRRMPGGRSALGGGSAVVIAPDGFLLTSAHVVEGSVRGVAAFVDGRDPEFEVVGR